MSSDVTVASFAAHYLRGRSWGIAPALAMMVATGTCRGMKDMVSRRAPWNGLAAGCA